MRTFSRRASQKIEKLSPAQIQSLVNNLSERTEAFSSIFQSLSTGLMIVSTDWRLREINKAAERYLPFSLHHAAAKSEGK
ncbi:MAG: two-component sensor histidine kinase, partial [Treponemataceae bacterium]|nr:two-component sensor histidine kinase [Treponemataceae bacterium]